jgi:cyclohexanone monooxygenase
MLTQSTDAEQAGSGFDPDALRARYRAERDRRLRADGNHQYRDPSGVLGDYLDDPYAEPGFRREPLTDEVEVLVIGAGFGGLLAAVALRRAGIDDVRLVEKAGDVGGTWYWNRYPGAACDVESYIYLPLLEETGYVPVEKYARGADIQAYSRQLAEQFDLYANACFQTEVTELSWDEPARRWVVRTNWGDEMRARYVLSAGGPLHRPKLPAVAGIETFAGHTFHTSRWDYDYTGPTAEGLPELAGKRVGIIGTGATAVQAVPHLGASGCELFVFQRTPSSVDVRANRPTDPEWARSLRPGWQRERMDNFNELTSGRPVEHDLVDDGWTDIFRKVVLPQARAARARDTEAMERAALADLHKMEEIRARVDALVEDPATAESLKPYYNQMCKRPCFHDEYLQTFNRPTVHLVDTRGRGVDRITEHGVVVDGREYPLDCLIYATGFEINTELSSRMGFTVRGRDGHTLREVWEADGPSTLHGLTTSGFPNLFIFSPTQAAIPVNFTHVLAEQAEHLAYILGTAAARGATTVEAGRDAQDAWTREIVTSTEQRRAFLEECTPGYYNNEGQLDERSARHLSYGRGPIAYVRRLREWRESGELSGLELR